MKKKTKVDAYQKLIEGIEEIIESGQYASFLKSMKNFHNYSFRNRLLIFAQNPNATRVAGYCTWKKLGRGVKSHPNKIFILKPMIYKIKQENNKSSDEEKEEYIDDLRFGWTIVYDIEDTYVKDEGNTIPLFDDTILNDNTSEELYNILLKVSPVQIFIENTYGSDGYYSKNKNKIAISQKLSQDDKTATLLHEICHALYDDFDYSKDRDLSEIFVESVAFLVADYFNLDTSKCSLSYITKWSKGDSKKILELGSKIQETSDDFIKKICKELDKQEENVA